MARVISIARAYKAAEKYLSDGNLPAAISVYKKITETYPGELMVINTLGDLCVRAGRTEDAIKSFHSAASRLYKDNFNLKAIAIYKKINKLAPNDQESYIKLAELYARQGLISE